MYGQIQRVTIEAAFDFFRKQPFAADGSERPVGDAVAAGGDALQGNGKTGTGLLQELADVSGLPQGQTAAAGPDDERIRKHGGLLSR